MNSCLAQVIFIYICLDDGSYKESFESIIDQLKEEMKCELEKLDDNYNLIIKEKRQSYSNMNIRNNSGIRLIEEKFRLDIYNTISNVIYPNK